MVALLFPLAFIVGIVLLVLIVRNFKSETFPQIIRLIYMYLVMGVTLFLCIIGAILTWNSIVDLMLGTGIHSALLELCPSLAMIGVGLPTFIYHNKKVRKD